MHQDTKYEIVFQKLIKSVDIFNEQLFIVCYDTVYQCI